LALPGSRLQLNHLLRRQPAETIIFGMEMTLISGFLFKIRANIEGGK
jgi:hypothetical protein